jgi:hypothetical protein
LALNGLHSISVPYPPVDRTRHAAKGFDVMTFGVDQCRCCGAPIKPAYPEQLKEYLDAVRKPTMPEAEWRRRGFLAVPTRMQLHMPHIGCCQPCAQKQVMRATAPAQRMAKVAVAAVVGFSIIWVVALYITH